MVVVSTTGIGGIGREVLIWVGARLLPLWWLTTWACPPLSPKVRFGWRIRPDWAIWCTGR